MTTTHKVAERPHTTHHAAAAGKIVKHETRTPEEIAADDAKKAEEAKAKAHAAEAAKPPTKEWVRREMELKSSGHTQQEREAMNP